jgi:cell wall-active antibiotic response 4TMS protein YvqF
MTIERRGNITPHLIFGVSVMLLGFVLMLDVLGVLRARDVLRYWPALLIAIGVATASQATDRGTVLRGSLMAFFGTWLLLATLHVLPSLSWRLFWPFVLMLAGAALVLHTWRRASDPPRGDSSERVSIVGVLGGGNRMSTANPFRGGDLVAIMGGGQIDLRRAVIPPGEQAIIDIVSLMGGFEIIVPETWAVDDRTMPIMGGVGNETRTAPGATPPVLILRGVLMMGGVSIRN